MPLALTDVQLAVIRGLAEPLHPEDRDGYLRRIAELMHGREVGDGSISRAARTAQSEFLRPPILATAPRTGNGRARTERRHARFDSAARPEFEAPAKG